MEESSTSGSGNFWAGKIPCWVIRQCIPEACQTCSAYLDQSRPCWEIDDTLCKKLLGLDTCVSCEVYKLYGPEAKNHVTHC